MPVHSSAIAHWTPKRRFRRRTVSIRGETASTGTLGRCAETSLAVRPLVVGTTSALGFAGSFVVILFLAYFLSSVFLFGAEVTKVYADRLQARKAIPEPRQLYSDDPQVLVAEPPSGLPQAAFVAFLAGLFVGWRRRGR